MGKKYHLGQLKKALVLSVLMVCLMPLFAYAHPRIISVSPTNLRQLDQAGTITVTANVYDATDTTSMQIDGNDVPANLSADTVSYNVYCSPGIHRVYLEVTNTAGERAERLWQFYVNDPANPFMLPGNQTCEFCHGNPNSRFPGHMKDLRITNGHPYNCGACHPYRSSELPLQIITRPDGSNLAGSCTDCHTMHGGTSGTALLRPLPHGHISWRGTWLADDTTIKDPRVSQDCQYCHQPGTKVRLGHDLVTDHTVNEAPCTDCHSGILTVVHNKNGNTCSTCHQSTDPVIQGAIKSPMAAKAGNHVIQTGLPKLSTTIYYNDLDLITVSLTVYGPNNERISPEWTPGEGYEIKRVIVDDWKAEDRQYILAYVELENKWYTLAVADEGRVLYGMYPSTSPARVIFLPPGTTKIKTKVVTGQGDVSYTSGLNVKQAYYGQPASCTDCHQVSHEAQHAVNVLDYNCTTCHINNLSSEHLNNTVTQDEALDCDSCHKSSTLAVREAIITDNSQCAACHREGHNMVFAETVPADIPLYDKFKWSLPAAAGIWSGEGWIPEEYLTGGRVVVSEHRSDVTADEVWNFYQNQMSANGWTLTGIPPAAGIDFFTVTFTKDSHKVILWFGADGHNAPTGILQSYSTEILYK